MTNDNPLILVIDDDIITTTLLKKVLTKYQYHIVVANDPLIGLQRFEEQHPKLIILDVNMPNMNGYQVCENVRQHPTLGCTPVIMLTDQSDEHSIERAFHAGATDFLHKPINWELLRHRLRFALRAQETDEALRKTQQNLTYAQQLAKLAYWEWNLETNRVSGSDEVYGLFGHEHKHPMSREEFLIHLTDKSLEKLDQAIQKLPTTNDTLSLVLQTNLSNNDECVLNILGHAKRNIDGELIGMTGSVQDITRISKAEATIVRMNLHDNLTDLPNRSFFVEILNQAIQKRQSAKGNKSHVAIMTLDIDRFKLFNQSLGIHGADSLLKSLAHRLSFITREGDAIARLGSDEFVVLIDLHPEDHIEAIASRYHSSLLEAYTIDNNEVFITPSIGIALYPMDAEQAEDLMGFAHTAKTRAKQAGGNQYQFYTASMNQQAAKRLKLEHDLRRAIDLNQLRVYFQPKINSIDLRLIGAEALIRWQHPEWGLVRPDEFIPIAEETGMILEIGEWILNQACLIATHWRRIIPDFHIGVNLSARQFLQSNLIEQVQQALAISQLPAEALDLEITESLAMADAERNIDILRQLKALNIHLSIDDFGTGYSSLSYLHAFPVNTIKIDRSFIMNIGTEQGSKADEGIAAAIIAMAKSLDLSLVAEGVENEFQVNFLRSHGCQVLQGFHFGKPQPKEEFERSYPLLLQ